MVPHIALHLLLYVVILCSGLALSLVGFHLDVGLGFAGLVLTAAVLILNGYLFGRSQGRGAR